MSARQEEAQSIKCPACGAVYRLTQWTLLKMLRRPQCSRCGASLKEILRARIQQKFPGVSSGQVTCPRCGQVQEPNPNCKWCGTPLSEPVTPRPQTGPLPSRGLPWLRILSTVIVLMLLVLMPLLQEMQLLQAYQASKTFLVEDNRLGKKLGGELQWGPIPFFFWRSLRESPQGWKGSFYFLAKGPRTTAVAVVQLERPAKPTGQWRVTEGSYALDVSGNKIPLSGPPKKGPPTGT